MQTLAQCGRVLTRALFTSLNTELSQTHASQKDLSLHFLASASGCGKTISRNRVGPKWSYGDDACFIARHNGADVIGVADGVGGWRSYGIDPSLFSSKLMQTSCRLVREGKFKPWQPTDILADSYHELRECKIPLLGSSTACIVSLYREESRIYTCNLGDSGFLVVRNGSVVHKSSEQQHYFNTPYQLSLVPAKQRGAVLCDSPHTAHSTSFPVEEGDLVVLGTDGLFDNLHESMILQHVNKINDHDYVHLEHTAHCLVSEAKRLAADRTYLSPFALNAQAHGLDFTGGKPDDITVVLARVGRSSEQRDDVSNT